MTGYTYSLIMALILLVVPTKVEAADSSMTLLCQWDINGGHFSKNYHIDENKKTVDGAPANFSEDMIIADISKEGGHHIDHVRINRLSGTFSEVCSPCAEVINGRISPYIMTQAMAGKCEKAPEAKKF